MRRCPLAVDVKFQKARARDPLAANHQLLEHLDDVHAPLLLDTWVPLPHMRTHGGAMHAFMHATGFTCDGACMRQQREQRHVKSCCARRRRVQLKRPPVAPHF